MNEKQRAIAFKYGQTAPKSLCTCGHTGDGAASAHVDTFQTGHGACLMAGCSCKRFTWEAFTLPFTRVLAEGTK